MRHQLSGYQQYPIWTRRPTPKDRRRTADINEWVVRELDFHPDEIQRQVLVSTTRRGILNCSRQWGKSTVVAAKALHHAVHNPDSLILVAAPSMRQSVEFLKKARQFVRKLGFPVKGDGENKASIVLPNQSRILGVPDNEDTVRCFSGPALLLVDEASRVSDGLYHSLRPMLATSNGALWLMSTPNGKQGFFYEAWTQDGAWTRIQATAEQCPRIPKDFLDEERRTISSGLFRQEYCCEFVAAEGALFDEDLLRSRITKRVLPLW